jgi:hypothetical protein
VPLDSQPIEIASGSFYRCFALANLVLPKGSNAAEDMFTYRSSLLHDRFDEEADSIVAGLVRRFDNFPVHRLCYDDPSSRIAAQELCECIERTKEEGSPLVDDVRMSPFHVLFSTIGPSQDLLEVLLEKYPYDTGILDSKDANGKRPVDYLLVKLD